jgi:hypothetical protein
MRGRPPNVLNRLERHPSYVWTWEATVQPDDRCNPDERTSRFTSSLKISAMIRTRPISSTQTRPKLETNSSTLAGMAGRRAPGASASVVPPERVATNLVHYANGKLRY